MTRKDHVHTARRTKRSILSLVAALAGTLALVAAGLAFAAPAANATPNTDDPQFVAVCHWVPGQGNDPANLTFIDKISFEGWVNGHQKTDPLDQVLPYGSTAGDCTQPTPPPPVCDDDQTLVDGECVDNETKFVAVCHYVPGEGNLPANWTFIEKISFEGWVNGHQKTDPLDKVLDFGATAADCGTPPTPLVCTPPQVLNADKTACVTPETPSNPPTTPGGPTPPTDYCANLAGVQWEGYDCNTGQQVVSAEAVTVVAAPAAGTVAPAKKPAKKPAKVHVAQPANVDAGVATLPTAAKVPSAVNAGGGSSGDNGPNTGLLILAMAATGVCLIATGRLLATRSR